MAELTLFDGDGADEPGVPCDEQAGTSSGAAYSVCDLNVAIAAVLRTSFPDRIWVRGEVVGLGAGRNGHRYFNLVDQREGADRPDARIEAVAFAGRWRTIEWRLRRARIHPEDGLQLCFRCRVDVFEPAGRLQLVVEDVDPEWTLGHMAAGRDRLLAELEAEGLLRRNALVAIPPVPLRVGLLTSVRSAAYTDFVHELTQSGFGFQVVVVDCQTQGPETVRTVVAGLGALERQGVDVVALVRGGGSRTDLMWFDDEAVARSIAASSVPVITGIGHEIDSSVADAVAHTAYKTPTAAAAALVEAVAAFRSAYEGVWASIARRCTERLRRAESDVAASARHTVSAASRAVDLAGRDVSHRRHALASASRSGVRRSEVRVEGAAARLALPRLGNTLDRIEDRLRVAAVRVPARAGATLRRVAAVIAGAQATVRAYDPARVLERGYSLTLDSSGRAVRDAAELVAGQRLRTVVAHGEFTSHVSDVMHEGRSE